LLLELVGPAGGSLICSMHWSLRYLALCLTACIGHEQEPVDEAVVRDEAVVSVMGLEVHQFADRALYFDGLRGVDLGAERRDGRRFRVHDRWRKMIEFTCRSFEEIWADVQVEPESNE
jgi:hypothetical protein